jgi:hypothetical protein
MRERFCRVAFADGVKQEATEGEAWAKDLHDPRFADFPDLVNHAVLDCLMGA